MNASCSIVNCSCTNVSFLNTAKCPLDLRFGGFRKAVAGSIWDNRSNPLPHTSQPLKLNVGAPLPSAKHIPGPVRGAGPGKEWRRC
jgi:hypothetical protein